MNKILLALIIATSLTATAQEQAAIRENPDMEYGTVTTKPQIEYPAYINLKANHIHLNGHDWAPLRRRLEEASNRRVQIMHIGDSHLQADMGTAVTRRRLADRFGHGGRGLTVPFKLAGTNQPVDYKMTSDAEMEQSRLLKRPWPTPMGFTGIGVRPMADTLNLEISADEPFDSITFYYTGGILDAPGRETTPGHGSLALALPDTTTCTQINLTATGAERPTLHGVSLSQGQAGLQYHVIGNNGATYATYNMLPGFGDDIKRFDPVLIILSLGTNEAFNRISDEEFAQEMRLMLTDLRRACPEAEILLTTPSECQWKQKRRRRQNFSINQNVKRLRDVILAVAQEQHLPVYDFYAVAGGTGASRRWIADSTLNRDRIHLTRKGYTLQGNLITDAIEEALGY